MRSLLRRIEQRMVRNEPRAPAKACRFELQRHECFLAPRPLAAQAEMTCGHETEALVVFRVSENHNRTRAVRACLLERTAHECRADALALVIGPYCQRGKA